MCDSHFGSTWDPFGKYVSKASRQARRLRRHGPEVTPEQQAEIDAELAANERIAMTRSRRQRSSLFGSGSSVLGSPAVTSGAGSAMGRGGTFGGGGGGGPGGSRR